MRGEAVIRVFDGLHSAEHASARGPEPATALLHLRSFTSLLRIFRKVLPGREDNGKALHAQGRPNDRT